MNEFWKRVLETCVVILGNCLYAFGVAMFIVPGGLITGGTTGIALFVHHMMGCSVSVFVLLFNTVMFLIGFAVFGKKFAANTLVSTFSYPVALELFTRASARLCDHGRYNSLHDLWRNLYRRSHRRCDPCGRIDWRHGYTAACVEPLF